MLDAYLPASKYEHLDFTEFFKAMVHRSYCTRKQDNFHSGNVMCPPDCLPLQEESNERLEFLGDAVLNLIVAEYLHERFPNQNEGFLTRMRSKIVNGRMLSELAPILGLQRFVIVSKQIEESHGRQSRKILEDTFEAFMGAMYLTLTHAETKEWTVNFIETNVDMVNLVANQNSSKEILNLYFQRMFNCKPVFSDDVDKKTQKQVLLQQQQQQQQQQKHSPPTQPLTPRRNRYNNGVSAITVLVKDKKGHVVAVGYGANRKDAEEQAASVALQYYGISSLPGI
jgi:dsRNA-specific ribonuclease